MCAMQACLCNARCTAALLALREEASKQGKAVAHVVFPVPRDPSYRNLAIRLCTG